MPTGRVFVWPFSVTSTIFPYKSVDLVEPYNVGAVNSLEELGRKLSFKTFHSLQSDHTTFLKPDNHVILQSLDVQDVVISHLDQLFVSFHEEEIFR